MHDIETTNMLLPMHNDACSAHVTSAGDHDNVTSVESDKVDDFSLLEIVLDGVVDLDHGVWVADGAAVVSDDVRNAFRADGDPADFKQLIRSLFGGDSMDGEAAFDVVEKAEVLARLFD